MGSRVMVMSARPGRIKLDRTVPIAHPRHYSVKRRLRCSPRSRPYRAGARRSDREPERDRLRDTVTAATARTSYHRRHERVDPVKSSHALCDQHHRRHRTRTLLRKTTRLRGYALPAAPGRRAAAGMAVPDDLPTQRLLADTLAALGHCERMGSSLADAAQHSSAAVGIYEAIGEQGGEAMART